MFQSHAGIIKGVTVPRFGETESWSGLALPRAPNVMAASWKLVFADFDPVWNLRVREYAMAMLNPEHPAVLACGVDLGRGPYDLATLVQNLSALRIMARWAAERGHDNDISAWDAFVPDQYVESRRALVSPASLTGDIATIRRLHWVGPVLTGGGLSTAPWPGRSARDVAGYPKGFGGRENVKPQVWFALVRAAWCYIHDFAPDILAAREEYRRLVEGCDPRAVDVAGRLDDYLADPSNIIPLHVRSPNQAHVGTPNFTLLSLLMGQTSAEQRLRRSPQAVKIQQAVDAGRGVPGGLGPVPHEVERADGTRGPWHPGMEPRTLSIELRMLRAACYIFIAALSMMRDGEVRSITRDSLVEYYGAPALVSRKRKLDKDDPSARWWIIEPVAEAVRVAEALSGHSELVFSAIAGNGWSPLVGSSEGGSFESRPQIRDFMLHINAGTARHGLHIPDAVVTPHQLRKTMAMLLQAEPGGEIALGIQLKHAATRMLANRVTAGYGQADADWVKLLDNALDELHLERLSAFYDDYRAGKPIGFGPGAERITAAFRTVKETAEKLRDAGKARHGDARVEYDLLRKATISIRFGKLNHCAYDQRNPAGARCLEDTVIPDGHIGPLPDRCRPDRCGNSVVTIDHIPIWTAEKQSLEKMMNSPKIVGLRRQGLQDQLDQVNAVIERIGA